MGVTVSLPNNITTIEGNSLAVFKKSGETNFSVKDVNGIVEPLKVLGRATTRPNEGKLGTQTFTPFSQNFTDATPTNLIEFDFTNVINKYKDEIPNFQISGTLFCTQSACSNEDESATSNYLRIAFNLMVQINQSGQLNPLFSVSEVPATQEPTAQSFNSTKLFIFFDEAVLTDDSGAPLLLNNTFQDVKKISFSTKTNVTGSFATQSVKRNNGYIEVNTSASGNTQSGENPSVYIDALTTDIFNTDLEPS